MSGTSFTTELDLMFMLSREFEPTRGLDGSDYYPALCRNFLRFLTMGWNPEWTGLLQFDVIQAVLFKRNPELLKQFRIAFQQGFDNLYQQLSAANYSPDEHLQCELHIANCLTLLPFADLNHFETIWLPQYLEGQWQRIEYRITPIELTETSGISTVINHDKDRVFAYGLSPVNNKKATCHLIFMGTTYPAGQGFINQISADLDSRVTVGYSLYQSGKKGLLNWLEQYQDYDIDVCGTSLGGSMTLLFAIDQGDKLRRVTALNPAGIFPNSARIEQWGGLINKPNVIVLSQGNDLVSQFGIWLEGWQVLHVNPPAQYQAPNGIADHITLYSGLKDCKFIQLDVHEVNNDQQRQSRNRIWYSYLRSIVFHLIVRPYQYITRPVINFLWSNKYSVILFIALTILFVFIPVLSAGITLPALGVVGLSTLNASLPALGITHLLQDGIGLISKLLNFKHNSSQHDFNNTINHLLVTSLGGLLTASSIAALILIPTLAVVISSAVNPFVLALLIPVAFYASYKIGSLIYVAIKGHNNPPPMHRLDAPRVRRVEPHRINVANDCVEPLSDLTREHGFFRPPKSNDSHQTISPRLGHHVK